MYLESKTFLSRACLSMVALSRAFLPSAVLTMAILPMAILTVAILPGAGCGGSSESDGKDAGLGDAGTASDSGSNSDAADLPLITASRTSCTSPCAVFFDVSDSQDWNEIGSGAYTWSFGDGGAATGYMAAHVFELPEGAAETSYTVQLSVTRDGVDVAQGSVIVTVSPLSGRTLCVSSAGDFDGCPSSDAQDRFTDVDTAWAELGTRDRILLRRGDSFSPAARLGSSVGGPVHVGAFGDPGAARPAIAHPEANWLLGEEWSLTDLDIRPEGFVADDSVISIGGSHVLLLRCHIHDASTAFVSDGDGYDFATHKFLFDNLATNIQGTNYIAGEHIAIIGNRIERLGENHHTIRVGGGRHVLIADNELISEMAGTSLTVRGAHERRPGSDWVLVQNNLLAQVATVRPQNDESIEELQHVIWERNLHIPHDSQTSIQNGLHVVGHDMIIRNNIFFQIRRAIGIWDHPLAGPSRDIGVFHNTQHIDQDPDNSELLVYSTETNMGIVVQNNLAVLLGSSTASDCNTVPSPDAVVENNYCFASTLTNLCILPDGSLVCTDPELENTTDPTSADFMLPAAISPAVDSACQSPVFEDFFGVARPRGAASDVGAVER